MTTKKFRQQWFSVLWLLIALFPIIASAQGTSFDFSHVIGLFNIFVGLMLIAAFLFFGSGFVIYIVRLGTVHREEGIRVMERGVITLFVLVVLVALVHFFQSHPVYATVLVSVIIAIAVVGTGIILVATQSGGEKKPARPERS